VVGDVVEAVVGDVVEAVVGDVVEAVVGDVVEAVDVALGMVTDVLPSGPPRRSGDESEAVHVVYFGFYKISAFLHGICNFLRLSGLQALAAWPWAVVTDMSPSGPPGGLETRARLCM